MASVQDSRSDTPRTAARLARLVLLAGLAVAAAALLSACQPPAPGCANPANEIVAENCKAGSPASEWDVQGDGDPSIQGFATDISVDRARRSTSRSTPTPRDYRLDIYRMGYYGGNGRAQGRDRAAVGVAARRPSRPASTGRDGPDRLRQLGGVGVVGRPRDRGLGDLLRQARARAGHRRREPRRLRRPRRRRRAPTCCSRPRTRPGRPTTATAATASTPAARARTRACLQGQLQPAVHARAQTEPEDWVFNAEYPMVRWLERNGYDVSYFTGVDSDRRGAELLEHKVFLSVGHDEYWSGGSARTSRRLATPASTWPSSAATRSSGRRAGSRASTGRRRRTARSSPTRRRTRTPRSTPSRRLDRDAGATRGFNPEAAEPENALSGHHLHGQLPGPRRSRCPPTDGKTAPLAQHDRRDAGARRDGDARRRHARLRVGRGPRQRGPAGGLFRPRRPPRRRCRSGSRTTARPTRRGRRPTTLTLYRARAARSSSARARSSGRGGSTAPTTRAARRADVRMQQATVEPARGHGRPAGDAPDRPGRPRRPRRTRPRPTSTITSPGGRRHRRARTRR